MTTTNGRTKKTTWTWTMAVALVSGVVTACTYPGADRAPSTDDDDGRPEAARSIARVRAVHLSRTAPALRLTHDDGAPMLDAIAFAGQADAEMPAGAHDVEVLRVDTGEQMTTTDTFSLADGDRWTLAVWGTPEAMRTSLIPSARGRGFRVVNLSPAGGELQADVDGSGLVLRAGEPSGTIGEDVGADEPLTLTIGDGADGGGGASYTLSAANADAGAGELVDLFVVDGAAGNGGTSLYACTPAGLVEIPANETVPNARLRALHLSPNAPAVDVFVDGAAGIRNLAFPSASAYASLAPGVYDVDVAPAGAGIGASVLSVRELPLDAGRDYTAVAFGNLPSLRALALEDDRRPVSAGNVRIRAAHTAEGVGQVDVLALGATDADNAVVFDDLDFADATASIEIPSAAIRLGLDLDDDLRPELVFDVPALPVGTVATLFAVAGTDGPFLFVATEDATAVIAATPPAPPPAPARVRVVHLSPDAPAVSVSIDGAHVIDSLSFFADSDFVSTQAGAKDIDVALAASPSTPILSLTGVPLAPDSFTTAVAFGRAAELRVLALDDDRSAPAAGNIRVRAVHTAVGIGTVDVYAVTATGNALLIDDLAFGTAADALEVPAGQYTIGLDVNDDTTIDLSFQLPHLAAGAIANLFAVTDAHGTAHLALQD